MTTVKANRTAIIGLGGFGLHAVAHLIPRLEFADEQRLYKDPDAPPLRDLVTYTVVLPMALTGRTELLVPTIGALGFPLASGEVMQHWNDLQRLRANGGLSALREALRPALGPEEFTNAGGADGPTLADMTLSELLHLGLEQRVQAAFQRLTVNLPTISVEPPDPPAPRSPARFSRQQILDSCLAGFDQYALSVAEILARTRVDRLQPQEDHSRTAVYLIASLADDLGSALLLPTIAALRDRLGDGLAEINGLLSLGTFSDGPAHDYESACVFVNLTEIEQRRGAPNAGVEAGGPLSVLDHGPLFDRCYLLDQVKASGALADDEHEVVVGLGNFLEAVIASEIGPVLTADLAPDAPLYASAAPYSSLGAATRYVPVRPVRDWLSNRLENELLQRHMLQPYQLSGQAASAELQARERLAEERGRSFANQYLNANSLLQHLSADLPLRVKRSPGSRLWATVRAATQAGWRRLRAQTQPAPTSSFTPLNWYTPATREIRELAWLPWTRSSLMPGEWLRLSQRLAHLVLALRLPEWALAFAIRAGLAERIQVNVTAADSGALVGTVVPRATAAADPAPDGPAAAPPSGLFARFSRGEPLMPGQTIEAWGVLRHGQLNEPYYQAARIFPDPPRARTRRNGATVETPGALIQNVRQQLVAVSADILIGQHMGLLDACAWLEGVAQAITNELARVQAHTPSLRKAEQVDQERREKIDVGLGGRPETVYGGRRRTGHAAQRPFVGAIVTRVILSTAVLSYFVLGIIFYRLPGNLSTEQVAYVIGLLLALLIGLGTFPLLVYHARDVYYRLREWQRQRSRIEAVLNADLALVLQGVLLQSAQTVANLQDCLSDCHRRLAIECKEVIDNPEPQPNQFDDTQLREAVYDRRLLEAIRGPLTEGMDEAFGALRSLWTFVPPEEQATPTIYLGKLSELLLAAAQVQAPGLAAPETAPQVPMSNPLHQLLRDRAGAFVSQHTVGDRRRWQKQPHIAGLGIEAMITTKAEQETAADGRGPFVAHDYLVELGYRAKPFLQVVDSEPGTYLQHIDCLLLDTDLVGAGPFVAVTTPSLRSDGRLSEQPPIIAPGDDPFTLTYLQTVHGVSLQSMSSLRNHQTEFARLHTQDLALLLILPEAAYQPLDGAPGPLRRGAGMRFEVF